MSAANDWNDTLAEMEAELEAIEAALELGEVPAIEPFVAPAASGPVPAELTDRAQKVVERGDALTVRLEAEITRIRDELKRLPKLHTERRESRFDIDA